MNRHRKDFLHPPLPILNSQMERMSFYAKKSGMAADHRVGYGLSWEFSGGRA
jgi:hypothetical protein